MDARADLRAYLIAIAATIPAVLILSYIVFYLQPSHPWFKIDETGSSPFIFYARFGILVTFGCIIYRNGFKSFGDFVGTVMISIILGWLYWPLFLVLAWKTWREQSSV